MLTVVLKPQIITASKIKRDCSPFKSVGRQFSAARQREMKSTLLLYFHFGFYLFAGFVAGSGKMALAFCPDLSSPEIRRHTVLLIPDLQG
jgi:hypothetical protein